MEVAISGIVAFIVGVIVFIILEKKGINLLLIGRIMALAVCISFVIVFSLLSLYENNKMNDKFALDGPNKYTLYRDNINGGDKYYYIDFNNDEIKEENESDETFIIGHIRFKRFVKKKYVSSIKEIINSVVNNEDNLIEIQDEDKSEYFRNKIYFTYKIETSEGNVFYIKDIEQIKKLERFLNNIDTSRTIIPILIFLAVLGLLLFICITGFCILEFLKKKRKVKNNN